MSHGPLFTCWSSPLDDGAIALERGDKKAAVRFKEVVNGCQSQAEIIRSMLFVETQF
jgi:hypothetical protein